MPRAEEVRMILPPLPCLSICRAAARAISQDCVTLASMTSRKSSGFWSTILDTLFWPDATTRMSSPPNFLTAASTIASQFASELGRLATTSVLPPRRSHSAATFFSASVPLAQSTTLAPAPERVFAAMAPNAPDAPVTIAVLPLTENSDSGSFRKSSDMTDSFVKHHPIYVMAGLVPAIHVFIHKQDVDARHKAGHDGGVCCAVITPVTAPPRRRW